jgi:hypothetical protein
VIFCVRIISYTAMLTVSICLVRFCFAGLHWLGQRVRVFWKGDLLWYAGCIDDHYGSDRYHVIYDDDGMEEWITLPSVCTNYMCI